VGYPYPNGLEKALCKWDIYVPLVMKGLTQATHQVKQMNENVLLWETIQNNLLTTENMLQSLNLNPHCTGMFPEVYFTILSKDGRHP
jgi:hypothetical protein